MPSQQRPRNVFRRLLAAMVAFGVAVGVCFPFIARVVLDSERAFSWSFFSLCMAAGFSVGLANYLLFHLVISRELAGMIQGMQCISSRVRQALSRGESSSLQCGIAVATEDQLGQAAQAFNLMGQTIEELFAEERRLRELMASLASAGEPQAVARLIVQHLPRLRPEEGVHLLLVRQHELEPMAEWGRQTPAPRLSELPADSLERLGGNEQVCPRPVNDVTSTRLFVPLCSDRTLLALLVISCPSPNCDERQLFWQSYAGLVTPYLHKALLHKQLQEQASIDPLTRTFNRRFGMRRLQEVFAHAQRHGSPLSVIMFDIDHFKQINDQQGHQAGDLVLSILSMAIADNLRQEDVLCRYGGEEFLVLLPATDLAAAVRGAERLRCLTTRLDLPLNPQTQVSISLGVATWPRKAADDPQALLQAADQALYHAKRQGRNRVALHDGVSLREATAPETEPEQSRS